MGGSATVRAAFGGGGGRGLRGSAGLMSPPAAMAAATLGTLRAIPGMARQAFAPVARLAGRFPQVAKWTKRAAAAAGYIVIGGLVYDAAGNLMGKAASRRMNPLNHRALSRAIRRVKGAKRICRKVESITGSRARRASRSGRSRAAASCD